MTATLTRSEARKAENLARHERIRAAFDARVAAQDPADPLTHDPMWNPRHPGYSPDGPIDARLVDTTIPGDDAVPAPLPRGNGTTRKPATARQLHWINEKIRTTRLSDPVILRIKRILDAGDEITFDDAKAALDLLFAEPRTNRYDGACRTCGANVPAGTGGIEKTPTGRWVTFHVGDCPEATIDVDPVPDTRLDLSKLPVGSRGRMRFADPRHVTDPDAADLTRVKIQVDTPKSGKWAGYRFVRDAAVYGEGRRYGRQAPGKTYEGDAVDVLRRIVADPENAVAAYGKITNTCGACGAPLEDETSVALGIGPICRRKYLGLN